MSNILLRPQRPHDGRRFHFVHALSLFVVLSTGCEADRAAFSTVAANGVKLSTETGTSILASRDGLSSLVEGRLLVEGYTNKPLSPGAKAEIDKLSDALAARANALDELSKAYSAFGSLAAYDAAGEVEGAIDGLTDSVNKFATAVGSSTPPLSGVAGKIISAGSGQIAGAVQKAKLKAASAALRNRVERFRDLLKLEKAGYTGADKRIAKEAETVAIALWEEGFADPSALIRRHTGDLTPAADSKLIIDRVKQIRDAAEKTAATQAEKDAYQKLKDNVSSVLRLTAERRIQLTGSIIDQMIASFDDLIAAHHKLEAEQPITLDSLIAHLGKIKDFAEELKKLRDADRAAAKSS